MTPENMALSAGNRAILMMFTTLLGSYDIVIKRLALRIK
jgi:hypothetical protein